MNTHKLGFRMLIVGCLMAIIAVFASAAFVPASTAFADSGTPVPPSLQKQGAALEKLYLRAQKTLAAQKDQLTKANDLLAKAQKFIDAQKAKGKDITRLVSALEKMKKQVATAQTAHDNAANILKTHAGFDANGHVTDPVQARQTVTKAARSLQEAHRILSNLAKEFHNILQRFREKHGAT